EHRVGTLSMYRQLTGQVEPRIVIALDSFESMKDESFEAELLKLLTRISREGQAIGLHLVVTASRQANLRATFYSNFKHQLTLKQHDKTEVRSVVGATGLADIEDIKGRALYKGEEVYSLQLALPLRVDHDIELVDQMREEVSRQKAAWTGRVPEAIPMVPEELTREDFLSRASVQKAIASGQIPLGLDLETVEAVSWKIKKGPLLTLGDQAEQVSGMMQELIAVHQEAKKSMLVFAPELHSLKVESGVTVLTSVEAMHEMIEALDKRIQERMQSEETGHDLSIFLYQLPEWVGQLDGEHQKLLVEILEKGHKVGYGVLVFSDMSLSRQLDSVSKAVKTVGQAVLSMKLSDQTIVTASNKPLRESNLGPQESYYIVDKQATKIKVSVG
ncbi:TPA: hypothetical protein U1B06_001315, partial [Streptococcus suis]|nr:hypothetical protein [Streptococcus suis]